MRIDRETTLYTIAGNLEYAVEEVWDALNGDILDEDEPNVADSIFELAKKRRFEGLDSRDSVYVITLQEVPDAKKHYAAIVDEHRAKAWERGHTSLRQVLGHTEAPSRDDLERLGNVDLKVSSLSRNPDGSITITGTIDAATLRDRGF